MKTDRLGGNAQAIFCGGGLNPGGNFLQDDLCKNAFCIYIVAKCPCTMDKTGNERKKNKEKIHPIFDKRTFVLFLRTKRGGV